MTPLKLAALVYLVLGVCVPAAVRARPAHSLDTRYARITGYTCPPYCGYTAGGVPVQSGGAACSYDIPLWSTVYVAGQPFTCNDRGLLGSGWPSWIDIFAGSDASWVPATFGDWQYVEVDP